jgi:uncharacterized membrane protein (UPF0127 family)
VSVRFRYSFSAALLAAFCLGATVIPAHAETCRRAQHAPVQPLDIVSSSGKVIHLKVEVVDNEATRECGLMFRKSLAADGGMLFDFKKVQPVSFWMKNTLIPLDMLFIDQSGKIVNIYRQARPQSLDEIPSDGPVLGVLEIGGGRALDLDIEPGDKVRQRIFAAH